MATNREPPGTPTGGRYATTQHDEPDTALDPGTVSARTGDDDDFEWRLPNGDLHREDGPAVQWRGGLAAGGSAHWCREGELHRTDGPAWQYNGGLAAGGHEEWFLTGKLHRVGAPAVQRDGGLAVGGSEEWHLEGKKHRIGGPAVQWNGGVAAGGGEAWYREDRQHREDGPAVRRDGGVAAGGDEQFWLDGVQVAADQFEFLVACRGDTRRVAAPTERPSGGPQTPDGPVRPGV